MTTTVTVKTHTRPAAVTTSSHHNYDDGQTRGNGWSETTTFVPADSERTFTVTDTSSVRVQELKEGMTRLEPVMGEDAADI